MSEQCKHTSGEAILGGWDNEFVVSDVSRKLGLLTKVITWFGDDQELGMQTGEIPTGYDDGAKFKQWIRGEHSTETWFQTGPYQLLKGPANFTAKLFGIIGDRASGNVLYTDIFDYTSGTSYKSKTFALSDFPSNSDGFVIFYPSVDIQNDHRYETRVMCLGAASVSFYMLRWEIHPV